MRLQAARLLLVPQARAAGRDAAVGRDAGHLGEDQPGAALRAGAEVDQVESPGTPSLALYIAIGETTTRFCERHLAQAKGREHRRDRAPGRLAPARPANQRSKPSRKARSRRRRFSWLMRWLRVSRL